MQLLLPFTADTITLCIPSKTVVEPYIYIYIVCGSWNRESTKNGSGRNRTKVTAEREKETPTGGLRDKIDRDGQ